MNQNKNTATYYKMRYFVSEADLENIREAGKVLVMEIHTVFEQFYKWLQESEDFSPYLNDQFMSKIQELHWKHWSNFFQGKIDEEYIKQRKESGELYASIGLPLELYYSSITAFSHFFEFAFTRAEVATFEYVTSFNRLVNMDTAIAMDTYTNSINQTMMEQNRALADLSTPVTQLWNGILLLPLVGVVDSKRAQDTMSTILNKIGEYQSKAFILDISGISVVDTAVANYLIKMARSTRLMGCRCIISGVGGSVAQTIVELGINTSEIETTGAMQDALDKALRLTGSSIQQYR